MDFITVTDVEEAASIPISNRESQLQIIQPMDPDLYEAATMGNIETFRGKGRLDLEQMVTDISHNTILHINIESPKGVTVDGKISKYSEKETKILTKLMDKMLGRPRPLPLDKVNNTEFVKEILDICPSLLHQVNAKGDTPLHVAARCGDSAVAELLLQRARHQNQELESALRGDWEMLRMTNEDGNTALHEAVRNGNVEVVKILTKDAEHDFSYFTNKSGQTPLYLAASHKGYSETMAIAILESCSSPAHEGPNGKTALHAAAKNWSLDVIEAILKRKGSLTKTIDNHGWTPLHYAAYYHDMFSIAKALLESDRSAAYVADKDRKMTALHLAASQGHIDIIKEIISHSPECYDMVDNRGWNFLHFAMVASSPVELYNLRINYQCVRSLINEKDVNGNTPLHVQAAFHQERFSFDFGDEQAVNNKNVSVEDIRERGCPELKEKIDELTKDVGNGQYPWGVINKTEESREKDSKEQWIKEWEKTREAHLVVAALIATVTFAAAFTVPGGYDSEKGSKEVGRAILRRNSAFQAFVVTDAIAMTLSLSAVFIHYFLSIRNIQEYRFDFLFPKALSLTLLAMGAMVIAFVTGTYAVLEPSLGLALATCFIGLTFFLLAFWVLRGLFNPRRR